MERSGCLGVFVAEFLIVFVLSWVLLMSLWEALSFFVRFIIFFEYFIKPYIQITSHDYTIVNYSLVALIIKCP